MYYLSMIFLCLIGIGLIAGIASIIISMLITPMFQSSVIMFPASSASVSKDLLSQNYSGRQNVHGFGEEEQAEQISGMGIDEPAGPKFVRVAYGLLDLISFFTIGEKEVRAWSIRRGSTAWEAAGKVHTDMARGFIRAETVAFDDLHAAGNMREAKAAGKIRQEHKGYVVQDGDVITVKFNV